ncbi:MAG: hypothetical protein A2X23_06420 [Chloroflexi bacterium GWC2_73_18]|nr:MAG: hypothetical protein A2X23_06420 [Chloroflexi bacterium GWC2_73_18]
MVDIRRFSVIRTANVVALMYVIAMAIFFVPILLLLALYSATPAAVDFGFLAAGTVGLVILTVFNAIGGWIVTALACLIYNLAARWVGGIEVQVEQVAAPAPTATAQPPGWGPPVSGQPTAPGGGGVGERPSGP